MPTPLFSSNIVREEDRLKTQLSMLDQSILSKIIGFGNVLPTDYKKLHEAYIKSDVYKKIVLDRNPADPINFSMELDNAKVLTNTILTGVEESPKSTGDVIQAQIKLDRSNVPLSNLDRNILQRILAGSFTIPSTNQNQNQIANQDSKKSFLANTESNQYSSSNRYNDNILTSLERQRVSVFNFIESNPLFTLKRQALYALDIPERLAMNPLSPVLALLPGVGGNITDTILGGVDVPLIGNLSVNSEQYFKQQDRNKIKYSDIYAGTFVKRGGSIVDLAAKKASSALRGALGINGGGDGLVPSPDENYFDSNLKNIDGQEISGISKYISLDGNKIIIRTTSGINASNEEATFGIVSSDDKVGYFENQYNFDQYIDDKSNALKAKYGDSFTEQPYSPRSLATQSQDYYDEEYDRLIKKFYFKSNINAIDNKDILRRDFNLHTYDPTLNDKYMLLMGGINGEITESYGASWVANEYIGNSQAIPLYQSTSRNMTINLILFADIREKSDDAKLEKFNSDLISFVTRITWIGQHLYPLYNNNIIYKAPFVRLNLGDLFVDQVAILKTLDITWKEKWDIGDENAKDVMFPMIAELTLNMDLIHTPTPSSQTIFYTLARN